MKHFIREFSCGWIYSDMGTMHKKIQYYQWNTKAEQHKELESQWHSSLVGREATFREAASSWCDMICNNTSQLHTTKYNSSKKVTNAPKKRQFSLLFFLQLSLKLEISAVKLCTCSSGIISFYLEFTWINWSNYDKKLTQKAESNFCCHLPIDNEMRKRLCLQWTELQVHNMLLVILM